MCSFRSKHACEARALSHASLIAHPCSKRVNGAMGCGSFWRTSKPPKSTPPQRKPVEGETEASVETSLKVSPPFRSSRSKGLSEEKTYTPEQEAAAEKIGAALRGSATRWQVKEDYHELRPREGEPLDPQDAGFSPYAQSNPSMPVVSDHLRFKVRDVTKQRVVEQLGHDEVLSMWSSFEDAAGKLLQKVAESAQQLPPGPMKQMSQIHLFQGDEENAKEVPKEVTTGFIVRRQENYLLGKFQVVAVPVIADYDSAFNSLQVEKNNFSAVQPTTPTSRGGSSADCDGPQGFNGWFWVLHSAAPNIGESAQAEDFLAYSVEERNDAQPRRTESNHSTTSTSSRCCWKDRPTGRPSRRLNEDVYIADIARLWRNALNAMLYLEVEDAIFFPFGMGAFLRHLKLNDDRYEDPACMRTLKRRIADELMNAISDLIAPTKGKKTQARKRPPFRVHLCLVCVNPESIDNHNCFVEAAAAKAQLCPELKEVLQLRRNVDSLQLAYELGKSNPDQPLKVALLNGANRKLCGNHWFQSGARYAIDENLHRRSASLSRASLLVNFDTEPRPREVTQLEETVRFFGGSVVDLAKVQGKTKTDLQMVNIKAKQEVSPSTPTIPRAKGRKSLCCCGSRSHRKAPKSQDRDVEKASATE